MQDGTKNIGKCAEDVRIGLTEDERGGTDFDGISLYIAKPKALEHHYIILPGTNVGSDYVPFLDPDLCYFMDIVTNKMFGSVTCGRI